MNLPYLISDVTLDDIKSLVSERQFESANLDFKRELPGRNDKGKHDFAADVSAFANSAGGDLVYGIEDDGTGMAKGLVELTGNRDEEVRRLQDIAANGIEPRVPGLQIQAIEAPTGFVVVVRVPQSWAGPHRVKASLNFFIREGARNRPIDVPEIRTLVLRSDNRARWIRDFRTERLGKIMAGEAPDRLVPGAAIVVHIVPSQTALGLMQIDPVQYVRGKRHLALLGARGWNPRINADGAIATEGPDSPEGCRSYALMFRNGSYEVTQVLYEHDRGYLLPSSSFEEELMDLLYSLRREYSEQGFSSELTCMVSVIRANEVRFATRVRAPSRKGAGRFDRATLVLPEVLISADLAVHEAARPVLDLVWQSAGFYGSENYDEQGNWKSGH